MLLTVPIRTLRPATPRATIVELDLHGHDFPFAPGQSLSIASHGVEPRRPYSIASAPDDTAATGVLELLVGVGGDGTAGPHLRLQPGALVDIDGPQGGFTFTIRPETPRLLFVAGGTGISPLRAMLRHALASGFTAVGLLYSARTADDFAYEAELRELASQGRLELLMTVTRETEPSWAGARGRIDAALLKPLLHDPDTLCFVCGPRPLVDDVPRALNELGVAADHIRVEEWWSVNGGA